MKHTPGPWIIINKHYVGGKIYRVCASGAMICDVNLQGGIMGKSDEIPKANAHLIAAAPDLLEACKMVIEFSNDNNIHRFLEIAIPKIEQAIAKAEGK